MTLPLFVLLVGLAAAPQAVQTHPSAGDPRQ